MLTDDILSEIQSAGLGTIGADLFVGQLPPNIEGTVVTEYGGEQPTLFFNGGGSQKPKFQVFARYNGYETGRNKIEAIFNLLITKYQPLGTPAYIGTNENNQYEFSVNFKTIKDL